MLIYIKLNWEVLPNAPSILFTKPNISEGISANNIALWLVIKSTASPAAWASFLATLYKAPPTVKLPNISNCVLNPLLIPEVITTLAASGIAAAKPVSIVKAL